MLIVAQFLASFVLVSGTLVVRIPYRFAWEELPPIEMSLDVRSQWQAKF